MTTLENMAQLGAAIKQSRKKQHLTQEELAASCGAGVRFIRELEKGKETCHIGKALLVLKMLGLNIMLEDE